MEPTENAVLESIRTGLDGIKADLATQVAKRDAEIAENGKATKQTLEEISKLDKAWQQANADLKGEVDSVKTRVEAMDAKMGRAGLFGGEERKTAGQLFIEAQDFKDGLQGILSGRGRVRVSIERKTLFDGAGLGTFPMPLSPAQRLSPVDVPPRTLHLRDILSVQQAGSATIEYIRQETGPWVAGIQDQTVSEGNQGLKLEQELNVDPVAENAKTVAHWIPVTKQSIQDNNWLRAWIDTRLARGLPLAEDFYLLYGTGLNGQPTGLMVDNAVQETGFGDGDPADTPGDTIRRAMTRLQMEYYAPNGIVLNPLAWEVIELTKDGEERYIWFFGPRGLDGVPNLWRLPVIVTPAINQSEFLIGDFSIGATLWDWESPTVTVGYINDQFVRNELVVLAEERIVFTRQLPRAFVRGELNLGLSS